MMAVSKIDRRPIHLGGFLCDAVWAGVVGHVWMRG